MNPTLNSSSPTDTQQALYMLPQSDYNVIASGTNGYSAEAGYNLVTGLGTPVANLLVPDLWPIMDLARRTPARPSAPCSTAGLVNTGTSGGGTMDVFSVFDFLRVTSNGLGDAQGQVLSAGLGSPRYQALAPGVSNVTSTSALVPPGAYAPGPNWAAASSPAGLMPLPAAGLVAQYSSPLAKVRTAGVGQARSVTGAYDALSFDSGTDGQSLSLADHARLGIGLAIDSVLDELASDSDVRHAGCAVRRVPEMTGGVAIAWDTDADPGLPDGPMARQGPSRQPSGFAARLAVILLAAGFVGQRASRSSKRGRRIAWAERAPSGHSGRTEKLHLTVRLLRAAESPASHPVLQAAWKL